MKILVILCVYTATLEILESLIFTPSPKNDNLLLFSEQQAQIQVRRLELKIHPSPHSLVLNMNFYLINSIILNIIHSYRAIPDGKRLNSIS